MARSVSVRKESSPLFRVRPHYQGAPSCFFRVKAASRNLPVHKRPANAERFAELFYRVRGDRVVVSSHDRLRFLTSSDVFQYKFVDVNNNFSRMTFGK